MSVVLAILASMHILGQDRAIQEPTDPCRSAIIAQVSEAVTELARAQRLHGGMPRVGFTAVYEGTAAIEGHLMRPGMVRSLPVRLEIVTDPGTGSTSVRKTTNPGSSPQTEIALVIGERVAKQTAAKGQFEECEGTAARSASSEVECWLPILAVRAALNAAPSCRLGPATTYAGRAWSQVTYTEATGNARSLLLDRDHRIGRIESLASHPRLGDVCEWTAFEDWDQRDGLEIPKRLTRFLVQSAATVRYELTLSEFTVGPPPKGTFLLPSERASDIPTWGRQRASQAGFDFVQASPGVWWVEIAAANTRVMVIEREKDLVLLGAPDGDETCRELLFALGDRFQHKPIGRAAFSHHHPSPSGGLRAISAADVPIIAPRALEPYVRDMWARPTTLDPSRTPLPAGSHRLELFDRETTIDCGEATVRLIDIGEHSRHAFSYVVYYFPATGLLVEDDLSFLPADGPVRSGARLAGLVQALEEMHIEPKRLGQAFPVRGTRREVEWSSIKEAVVNAKPKGGDK